MDQVMHGDARLFGLRAGGRVAKGCLVMYDRATRFVDARPLGSKTKRDIIKAIGLFKGRNRIHHIYSDNCPALREGVSELHPHVIHDFSQVGIPESNSGIETMVKVVTNGARVALDSAGLPSAFWPYAVAHYCLARNIRRPRNGNFSAWQLRTRKAFEGLRIPFGHYVEFKPSPTSQVVEGRWDGRGHAGIFLGYVLNSGANFSKKTYLVARLSDFLGRNFHRRAYAEHVRVHIQEVSEIVNWNPKAPLRFPLRPVYE